MKAFFQKTKFIGTFALLAIVICLAQPINTLAQNDDKSANEKKVKTTVTRSGDQFAAEKPIHFEIVAVKIEADPNPAESKAETDSATGAAGQAVNRMLNVVQRPLSLNEAVKMALENNPDVEVSRQTVRSTEFDVESALGAFDFRFGASSLLERRKSPATNQFNTSRDATAIIDTNWVGNVRLEKPIKSSGGQLASEFSVSRATTNNLFNDFSRSYPTALTFSLTQPILRGRRFDESRRRLEVARRNLTLTGQQFRQHTIEIIANVERSYWDLALALKSLQVNKDAARDTAEQRESVRRRVAAGEIAPLDLAAVEAALARLEIDTYRGLDEVERAQNALKNLIVRIDKDLLWNESLLPTDDLNLNPPPTTLEQALSLALNFRVELEQNKTAQDINQINTKFLRDQTMPQVDLSVSYSLNGFAGRVNPRENQLGDSLGIAREGVNQFLGLANPSSRPPVAVNNAETARFLRGNLGQSLENLALNRFNVLTFGVTVNFPLGNRSARAELGKSLVEGERLETKLRGLRQTIQAEVRNSWTALQNAAARLRSAQTVRENTQREYRGEQRQYNAGRAAVTISTVLERQKQFNSARRDEVAAQIEINNANVDFNRVTASVRTL